MHNSAEIGKQAPLLKLSDWVAGTPTNLQQLLGRTILIEVFQVNCPGCFLYSLPQAIALYQRYKNTGLYIFGIATAFEDFDKNNLENLELLIKHNKVIGETYKMLDANKQLVDGMLPYQIPFPVAMDKISKIDKSHSNEDIINLINQHIPDFSDRNEDQKKQIQQQAEVYLQNRLYTPETFNLYGLQGTPSHIIIDKHGVLKAVEFGQFSDLEWLISSLLNQ